MCVFSTTPLSLQERSRLGFSAEQVLALASGEHHADAKWQQTEGVIYGPETGRSQVALRVAATGPARLARVEAAKSISPVCRDNVRIPIDVALATDGGAFDESFPATLVATSSAEASVSQSLDHGELRGSFAFSPETLGARRFLRLDVDLRFSSESTAGYLLGGIEGGDGSSASFQPVPLACWGEIPSLARPCSD